LLAGGRGGHPPEAEGGGWGKEKRASNSPHPMHLWVVWKQKKKSGSKSRKSVGDGGFRKQKPKSGRNPVVIGGNREKSGG